MQRAWLSAEPVLGAIIISVRLLFITLWHLDHIVEVGAADQRDSGQRYLGRPCKYRAVPSPSRDRDEASSCFSEH